jgi:hypothetical protein
MKKILLFTILSSFSIKAQTLTDYVTGLDDPIGIVFDNTGNLYVSEKGSAYKIKKVAPDLTTTIFSNLGIAFLANQITINPSNNNILVAADSEPTNDNIIDITPAGVKNVIPVDNNGAYGVAVDNSGNIFYSEVKSKLIKKRTPAGATTTFATLTSEPAGLTFDASGNLIVAIPVVSAGGSGKVISITPAGVVSDLVPVVAGARFLAYNTNGDLYISTGFASRIHLFSKGRISVFKTSTELYGIAVYNNNLYGANGQDGIAAGKVVKISLPALGVDDNEYKANRIKAYPNPANDFLSIENIDTDSKTIGLYDISGRLIESYKPSGLEKQILNLPALSPGNYILRIDNVSKSIIIK